MIVKWVDDLIGTARDVRGVGFQSLRVVLASDKMGFSVHKTIIPKGEPLHWHYRHHLEACFCVSGRGILTNLKDGQRHNIVSGVTYLLNEHDDHVFQAMEDTVLISIFNPPIAGREVHGVDGSYELLEVNDGI